MEPPQIVVGLGDRVGPDPVLRWAVAEAERRGCRLRILHAVRPDVCHNPDHPEAFALDDAARVVTAAAEAARLLAPGVRVTGDALLGCPATALVAAAGTQDLLVVGCPAGSGSTSQQVAARARSSVAAVRGATGPETGPIAVGYDGSPEAEPALLSAFESAAARACAVTVIRVAPFPAPGTGDDGSDARSAVTVRATLAAHTRRAVAPLMEKYPEVTVDILVVAGDPAGHLVAASRGARLVVVGARAPHRPVGRPLGPVGLRLLRHSYCPVLFARAGESPQRRTHRHR